MHICVTVSIGITSLLFSIFFGWKACEIFSVPKPEKWSQRFYLFWFNFFGSLVGWLALWLILLKIIPCIDGACNSVIEIGDILVALVAFAGITGHLPMSTMGIFSGLKDIAVALFKKWLS